MEAKFINKSVQLRGSEFKKKVRGTRVSNDAGAFDEIEVGDGGR